MPALFGQLSSSFLLDPARYPNVTGRTLGAIVVHSRNPPAAGIPSTAEPMVSVEVVGGSYANNDGSIIMSTAAGTMDSAQGVSKSRARALRGWEGGQAAVAHARVRAHVDRACWLGITVCEAGKLPCPVAGWVR